MGSPLRVVRAYQRRRLGEGDRARASRGRATGALRVRRGRRRSVGRAHLAGVAHAAAARSVALSEGAGLRGPIVGLVGGQAIGRGRVGHGLHVLSYDQEETIRDVMDECLNFFARGLKPWMRE